MYMNSFQREGKKQNRKTACSMAVFTVCVVVAVRENSESSFMHLFYGYVFKSSNIVLGYNLCHPTLRD
jgi:hypothetical protein